MSIATRAITAVALISTTILIAAQGDRIGQGLGFATLTVITAAQHIDPPRCHPNDPAIYIGGMLMAGCPTSNRR